MLLDELGELEEGVFELLDIGGLLASVAIEDGEALDFVDHAAGVPPGEGDDAEGDVLEDFDHDAAEAEHEDGPELGVLGHADDDLRAGAGHALYGYAFDDGVGLVGIDGGDDVVVGGGGLGGVLEAELHAAHVALVDDVGGDDLEYDGVADAPGLLDGLFLRGGKGGLGSLDAGVAKHLLGLDFVEENAALVTGPVQGLALGHGYVLLRRYAVGEDSNGVGRVSTRGWGYSVVGWGLVVLLEVRRWKTLVGRLCPVLLADVGLLRGVEALPPLVLDDKHGLSGEIVRL